MNSVTADPGELKMTIQITRKETGLVEEFELTNIDPVPLPTEGEQECQQP